MAAAAATASGNCQGSSPREMRDAPDPHGHEDRRADRRERPARIGAAVLAGRPQRDRQQRDAGDDGAHPGQLRRCPQLREKGREADRQHQRHDQLGHRRHARGATKYAANPASASSQCTISHADTRSSRTISAPTRKRRPADGDRQHETVERVPQARQRHRGDEHQTRRR